MKRDTLLTKLQIERDFLLAVFARPIRGSARPERCLPAALDPRCVEQAAIVAASNSSLSFRLLRRGAPRIFSASSLFRMIPTPSRRDTRYLFAGVTFLLVVCSRADSRVIARIVCGSWEF